MAQRKPQYTVFLDHDTLTITIQSSDGLNERALRDIDRMQWITVNHGWLFSDRIDEKGPYTKAVATFLHEEYVSASRYFDSFNHGIEIVNK